MHRTTSLAAAAAALALSAAAPAPALAAPRHEAPPQPKPKRKRGLRTGSGGRVQGGKVYANLSKWHPDYGMSPEQHEEQKALRAAGKAKFVPKEELRLRRGALGRSYGL